MRLPSSTMRYRKMKIKDKKRRPRNVAQQVGPESKRCNGGGVETKRSFQKSLFPSYSFSLHCTSPTTMGTSTDFPSVTHPKLWIQSQNIC
ncbi:unnamed protein product [Citrullus colocynthis]|uniref:Uncharacterized protein n=1 Tax=Citrullus colocynthis TaxID=252529 RepID=A0ABP0Z4Y7_9ROSI